MAIPVSNVLSPVRFVRGLRHGLAKGLCRPHAHSGWEIVLHISGRGRASQPPELAGEFGPNSVHVYRPNEMHDQFNDEPGKDACVHVSIPETSALATDTPSFIIEELADDCLCEEILWLATAPAERSDSTQAVCDLRAGALFVSILERGSHQAEDVVAKELTAPDQAYRFIAQNYRSIDSVAEAAEHVGLSYHHLRHLFVAQYGKSMVQALQELRIERAKLLLQHTALPQKQIACECGYATVRYFSSRFKKQTGMTPGAWRTGALGTQHAPDSLNR